MWFCWVGGICFQIKISKVGLHRRSPKTQNLQPSKVVWWQNWQEHRLWGQVGALSEVIRKKFRADKDSKLYPFFSPDLPRVDRAPTTVKAVPIDRLKICSRRRDFLLTDILQSVSSGEFPLTAAAVAIDTTETGLQAEGMTHQFLIRPGINQHHQLWDLCNFVKIWTGEELTGPKLFRPEPIASILLFKFSLWSLFCIFPCIWDPFGGQ